MKAIEQQFLVVLFISLYKVIPRVNVSPWIKTCICFIVAIEMKATERYFPTVYCATQGGSNF